MDLSFLINNPLVQNVVVSGVIGTVCTALGVGAYIAKWWRQSKYRRALNLGEESVANLSALRLRTTLSKIIKDPAILEATLLTFSEAPDNFNRGWDRGLRGLKLGTPEYEAYTEVPTTP